MKKTNSKVKKFSHRKYDLQSPSSIMQQKLNSPHPQSKLLSSNKNNKISNLYNLPMSTLLGEQSNDRFVKN